MKKYVVTAFFGLSAAVSLYAQGLVNFANTPTTPVYVQEPDAGGSYTIMSPSLGTFYFGLFLGQPSSGLFFTGLYATNTAVNGLFNGGVVAVPGWAPGASTNYLVLGWSGPHDFSPQWLGGIHPAIFGHDGPASGVAGNGSTIPVLNLFDGGPGTMQGIFQLQNYLVPEPSAAALGMIGTGIVVLSRGMRLVKNFVLTPIHRVEQPNSRSAPFKKRSKWRCA